MLQVVHLHSSGVTKPLFFREMNEEVSPIPREASPSRALILLATAAPILLPCKLESEKSISIYNPLRVLRQLRYDQGTVRSNNDMAYSSVQVAENKFAGRETVRPGLGRGSDAASGHLFWAKYVGYLDGFMVNKEEPSPKIAEPVP